MLERKESSNLDLQLHTKSSPKAHSTHHPTQVLGAVDPGSMSSVAACAHTLDTLGALQLRLMNNQDDWNGGENLKTKMYSINQVGGALGCATSIT